ncbi:MAG TPA: hypothetical protein VMF90_10690 [Rhizobiaceae bacterium]|nr:hypothetical protein [Rhizobiaceae bacterium]
MLKMAIVAMTIVGCDCDAKMCEFIRDEQPQWSTMAECEAALKTRIVRDQHENYPTVIAVCSVPDQNQRDLAMAAYHEAAKARTAAETTVASDGESTRIETIVSGGRAMVSRTTDGYATVRDTIGRAAKGTFSLAAGSVRWMADTTVTAVRSAW